MSFDRASCSCGPDSEVSSGDGGIRGNNSNLVTEPSELGTILRNLYGSSMAEESV